MPTNFLEGNGWYARFETDKALDNAINSLRREQAKRRKAAFGKKVVAKGGSA